MFTDEPHPRPAAAALLLLVCLGAPAAWSAPACPETSPDGLPPACAFDHDPAGLAEPAVTARVTDYRALESPLAMTRHAVRSTDTTTNASQNASQNASENDAASLRTRQWRHGYALDLWRAGEDTLLLRLADGRRGRFARDTHARSRFVSPQSDRWGEIHRSGDGYAWRLPDGREIRFQGSLPIVIRYPDGATLTLRYRHGRLQSITDHRNQALVLHYAPGATAPQAPDALELPDGTRLVYADRLDDAAEVPPRTRHRGSSPHPAPPVGTGSPRLDAVRNRLGTAHELRLQASRDGRLVDVVLDGRPMTDWLAHALAARITAGTIDQCKSDTSERRLPIDGYAPGDGSEAVAKATRVADSEADPEADPEADRIATLMRRLVEHGDACPVDAEHYAAWAQAIENTARTHPGGLPAPARRKRPDFSCLPPYKTCDELRENYRRAELAACVYIGGQCPAAWQPVTPASLGLADSDFSSKYFYSRLFYHPGDKLYVLSFRGTDGELDWFDNGFNAVGIPSNQYARATKLAVKVTAALQKQDPSATLEFTGHSMGGGLATVAALSTTQHATVFDPASLHASQARWLDTTLDDAGWLVDVLTLDGDIVTRLQRFNSAIRFVLHIPERIGVAGDAPGRHNHLPRPDDAWIEAYQKSLTEKKTLVEVLHSMDAMMESISRLLRLHCPTP